MAESRAGLIGTPAARLSGLRFAYDGRVLFDGFDFTVGAGEFVAVLGASGSGKSTLLRLAAGLLRPAAGEVSLGVPEVPGALARAMVFQDPRLLPWRKVSGNVELGLEALGLDKAQRRERALAALSMVGLAEFRDRRPHQLSGGQRQRVGLARALVVQPGLLLMDEPFAALDPRTRRSLQDLTLDLWRDGGMSVLFVTHDVEEALYLADRVVVLGGTPARLLHRMSVAHPRPRRRDSPEFRDAARLLHRLVGPHPEDDQI